MFDAPLLFRGKYEEALCCNLLLKCCLAEKVVYLASEGTGDGSSPVNALGSLEDAYNALGDEGGIIVVVGTLPYSAEFIEPEHTGTVTITGKYNGVDYSGALHIVAERIHLLCSGPTTFENVALKLGAAWVIRARFHHLTFGEGVEVSEDDGRAWPRLFLVGGDQGPDSTVDTSLDTHMTIKSGTMEEIIGGPRNGAPSDYTGKCVIEFGGTAKALKIALGTRGTNIDTGSGLLVLDGGLIDCWAVGHAAKINGFTGPVQIVLTKNFDVSQSFTNAPSAGIHYGISGSSVFIGSEPASLFSEAELLIDPSIKEAVEAANVILPDSFTSVKEYVYAGVFGSGTLDADSGETTEPVVTTPETTNPVVTPPESTDAGETTPPTGDASPFVFVIGAAALVAAGATLFLKKKEN